jgi:hypothetical protein
MNEISCSENIIQLVQTFFVLIMLALTATGPYRKLH